VNDRQFDLLFVDGKLGDKEDFGQHSSGKRVIADVLAAGFDGCTIFYTGDNGTDDDNKAFRTLCKSNHKTFQTDVVQIWNDFLVQLASNPLLQKRVVVVDDTNSSVFALVRNLEKNGVAVRQFMDGNSFLEAVLSGSVSWDALVLDYTMPGKSGLAVLEELPAHMCTAPIIMYSTEVYKTSLQQKCLDAGALECVSKTATSWREVITILKQNVSPHRIDAR